jgi:hypothetical protein
MEGEQQRASGEQGVERPRPPFLVGQRESRRTVADTERI